MSEAGSLWIKVAEKLFGITLIIIGALLVYYTATSNELGAYGGIFIFLSIVVIIAGAFLLVVSPPE